MLAIPNVLNLINQPNGVAGLDGSGNLVGSIIIYTGTATALTNLVPKAGQQMYATDTHVLVIGDGVSNFSSLAQTPFYLPLSGGKMGGDFTALNFIGGVSDTYYSRGLVGASGNLAYLGDADGANNSTVILVDDDASSIQLNCQAIGFFGSAPAANQTVTGSRGGNAAIASLLTALANLGLITNSTT